MFRKDYKPPRKVNVNDDVKVPNLDGFFDNLPSDLMGKKGKLGSAKLFLTQKQCNSLKIKKLKLQ